MATAFQRLISVLSAAGIIRGDLLDELKSLPDIEKTQQAEIDQSRADIATLQSQVAALQAGSGGSGGSPPDYAQLEARVTALETEFEGDLQAEETLLPIAISPTTLPPATVGTAYTQQLSATDGDPPYSFAATGLPADLTLSASGFLSGTPTAAETATIVVTVTDADGATAEITYTYTAS